MRFFVRGGGLALAAVVTAALTTACGGGRGSDPDQMTIGMAGVPPVFVNLMAYVARDKGYYKAAGLRVRLRPMPTGADVGRAVQSGQLDGGIVGTPGAIALRASGGSVVGVLGFEKPAYLVATTVPGIGDCASLKGRTIAVDGTGAPKALALVDMLASCHLTAKDVKMVDIGGPQTVNALIAGQVKIGVLHPDEMAAVRQKKKAYEVMNLIQIDPLAHYAMLIAQEQEMKKGSAKRAAWVKLIGTLHKAIGYLAAPNHSAEVAKIAATMTEHSSAITGAALKNYVEMGFWPTGDGLPRKSLEHEIERQVAAGNISKAKAPDYAELIDPTVFRDAVQK